MLGLVRHKLSVEYSTFVRGMGDRCAASTKFFCFSEVFQSLHCKISGTLAMAKPSQQLLPAVVVFDKKRCLMSLLTGYNDPT